MRADPTPYARIAKLAADLVKWYGIEPDTTLTWQVFGDRGANTDGTPVVVTDAKGKAVAQTFAATAADVAELAARHCNSADFPNVYLTLGLHDPPGRRQKGTCRRVLAVALDCDACDWLAANRPAEFADSAEAKAYLHALPGAELAELLAEHQAVAVSALAAAGLPKPSSWWRSGYGHYALYALRGNDDGATDVDLCRAINRDLVAALNGTAGYALADKAATDAGTRVLRAPEAFNVKRPDRPLVCTVLDGRGPMYTAAALRAAVPAPERPQAAPEPRGDSPRPVDPEGRMSPQETALAALPFIPADDYGVWVGVGQALHALGLAVADWDRWSQSSPDKYKPGACDEKWHTFDGSDKPDLAPGWLVNKAREAEPDFLREGWRAKQRGESSPPRRRKAAASGQDAPPAAQDAPEPADRLDSEGEALADVGHCRPGDHRCDDIGNAERFAELCGTRFRYCWDWQTWLVYDGTRWALDTAGAAMSAARAVARSILHEAWAAEGDDRSTIAKHALQTAKRGQLEAMLYLAKSDLAVLSKDLDTNPHLLNALNGTVDLRTGKLRPHNPADMITRRATSAYVPGADLADTPGARDWRRFIAEITNDDAELAAYLQRAAGYSVTGDPCEEVLFFAYGPERTGKSTFLVTINHHLADYADQVDFTAFLRKRDDSELKPELAKLQGKRFVASSETNAGRTLAEGLVKTITGNEPISARTLNKESVTWLPAFTLWLAANDRPIVRHDDGALWRRLKVVPFVHQVPAEAVDLGLKSRLREKAGEAVLAWLVRGCLDWQRSKLGTCSAVEAAIEGYREEMDPLGGWLADCCDVRLEHDEWFTPTDLLYRSFKAWCDESGEPLKLTQKQFGQHMTARQLNKAQRRFEGQRRHGYEGIRLTAQPELGFDDDDSRPGVTGRGNHP